MNLPYIDEFTYQSYASRRLMMPEVKPADWRLFYGLRAQVLMEDRFCAEILHFILAEIGECDA